MKTSNVLLGLWVVLVAGIAAIAVYFWKTSSEPYQAPPPGQAPTVVQAPGARKGTGVAKPPTPRPGRAGTPRETKPPVVSGRVIDAEGKPVEGAAVRLSQASTKPPAAATPVATDELRRIGQILTILDDDWDAIRSLADWSDVPTSDGARTPGMELALTSSGADGKFSFTLTSLAPRAGLVVSARHGDASASQRDVAAGAEVELVLSTGGLVTGTVTTEAEGSAVAGAKVVFDSGEKEYVGVTDETGAFRIEGMPPGRFGLRAGAKGRTPILDKDVTVARGEPVKVVLPRGTTLRIKAIHYTGEAAPGTEPALRNVDVVAYEETARVYMAGRTNDYGLVEFPALPPGSWLVNGRVEKFVSQGEAIVKLDGRQQVVEEELTFEDAVLTPVEVVDETGAPVAGVEFYTCDGIDAYDVLRSEKLPGTTDGQGKWSFPFEFDGPRAMVYGFKKGMSLVQAYPDDYSAGDPIRLVMKKAVRIHGKVVDENGNPAPDAIVRITFEPGASDTTIQDSVTVQVRTDASGNYDVGFVPQGYEASVEAETPESWSDDLVTLDPADGKTDHEVNLRLEPAADVRMVEMGGAKALPPAPPAPPVRGEERK